MTKNKEKIIGSKLVPYEDEPYNKVGSRKGRKRKYKRFRTYDTSNIPHVVSKVGQPSKYTKHYNDIAYQACVRYGCLDKDLMELFSINRMTLYRWKNKYPEFKENIDGGKR